MNKAKKKLDKKSIQRSLIDLKEALSGSLGDKAEEVKENATNLINDILENLQEKSQDYQESLEECITEKPLKSMAIAIGLGVLIAKVIL